jgi:hypothetical protein
MAVHDLRGDRHLQRVAAVVLTGDARASAAGASGSGSGAPGSAGAEMPARLLGTVPWLLCLTLAAVGVAGVTPLAWIGAALIAGLSLSGSI